MQRVLLDTIVQCPRFVDNTIHLIDLYMSKNKKYLDTGYLPLRNALVSTTNTTSVNNRSSGGNKNNDSNNDMVDNNCLSEEGHASPTGLL